MRLEPASMEIIPFSLATTADTPWLQAVGDSLGFASTNWERDHVQKYASESRDSVLGNLPPAQRHYLLTIHSGISKSSIPIGCARLFEVHGHETHPHHAWRVEGNSLSMEMVGDGRFAEVGAMIVHRDMQANAHSDSPAVGILGHQVHRLKGYGKVGSYARFLLAALLRDRFEGRACLSEFLPHLENGTNGFYESVIRQHLGGRSYPEADRETMRNPDLLKQLPQFLEIPPPLLDHLGKVGPKSARAAKNLEALGFQYTDRVDPIDAGPHWVGAFNTNPIFSGATFLSFDRSQAPSNEAGWKYGLLGVLDKKDERAFRGCASPYLRDDSSVTTPPEAAAFLGLERGRQVIVTPY